METASGGECWRDRYAPSVTLIAPLPSSMVAITAASASIRHSAVVVLPAMVAVTR